MTEDYGFKISQTGADVKVADVHNLIVTSKYPNPKTYIVGTYGYTFTSDIDSVTILITHNLGYIPPSFVYFKEPGAAVWGQMPWIDEDAPGYMRFWADLVTPTELVIFYREESGNPYNPTGESWNFKYYIMVDEFTI